MDGVLVDASVSYRAAIVATVRRYCAEDLGLPEPPADKQWAAALKEAGGFNNDWDLTAALIRGVAAQGPDLDVTGFARALRERGGGLAAVDALLGPPGSALDARGPLQVLFQEHYLSDALFEASFGRPRARVTAPGFIDRETALVSAEELAALGVPLAIATGRPRDEAAYTLRRLGLLDCFGAVVTHDDVIEASERGKPDPWALREAARRIGAGGAMAYVGDTGDDMRAALAAGYAPIGVSGGDPAIEQSLWEAGAVVVVASAAQGFWA